MDLDFSTYIFHVLGTDDAHFPPLGIFFSLRIKLSVQMYKVSTTLNECANQQRQNLCTYTEKKGEIKILFYLGILCLQKGKQIMVK